MSVCKLLLLFLPGIALAAPNVLAPSIHSDAQTAPAVTASVTATAGAGVINSPLFLDYDTNINTLIADVSNVAATTIFSIATNANVNHAPYFIAAYPFIGNEGASDGIFYTTLQAANAVAVGPGTGKGSLPSTHQLPASFMLVTSPNSGDGNQGSGGFGSEFFLSASYLGLNTGSDSADTGNLAGIAAAVQFAHGTFNAFDVHGALRQTAANWSAGWNTTNGYGNVNYAAASGTITTIFLQAPNIRIQSPGYYALITLYPFRTTRRVKEVVYIGGTWPAASTGNELSAAQITAAGGTLIYTSNGTDITPQFSYAPAASGAATFYALTLDAAGNGSRIEAFAPITVSFTVGSACMP